MRPLSTARSQSLARGLAILEVFTREEPSHGISEMARALGLGKSIVYRLVRTFADHGVLEQDRATAKYRIGARAFEIGQLFVSTSDLQHAALPGLRGLASAHKLNASLGVLRGRDVVYLNALQSDSVIVLRARPGARAPAHVTAIGKVLLAAQDDSVLDEILSQGPLRRCTPATITERPVLKAALLDVRRLGYATAVGEYVPGLIAVGAPIRDANSEVVAAVSGAGLEGSISMRDLPRLVRAVRDVASQISRTLGAPNEPHDPVKGVSQHVDRNKEARVNGVRSTAARRDKRRPALPRVR